MSSNVSRELYKLFNIFEFAFDKFFLSSGSFTIEFLSEIKSLAFALP